MKMASNGRDVLQKMIMYAMLDQVAINGLA